LQRRQLSIGKLRRRKSRTPSRSHSSNSNAAVNNAEETEAAKASVEEGEEGGSNNSDIARQIQEAFERYTTAVDPTPTNNSLG